MTDAVIQTHRLFEQRSIEFSIFRFFSTFSGGDASNKVAAESMPMPRWTSLLLVCASAYGVERNIHNQIRARVQPVLDEQAKFWNTSFAFGYSDQFGSTSLVSGVNNIWTGEELKVDTHIPVGSPTKTFTAVAILQYIERGILGYNDRADKWVDPVLERLNGTTMRDLQGEAADNITIYDLLHMTSGIQDYNDFKMFNWTINHRGEDLTPFDWLWEGDKGLACNKTVGTCGFYSSLNFIYLGLIILNIQKVNNWTDYDGATVIPSDLRASGRYDNTVFAKPGPCSLFQPMADQYAPYPGPNGSQYFIDMIDYSCENGWSCGYVSSTPGDLSNFYWDLFHGEYVSNETLSRMKETVDLHNDWCEGCKYGLGLFYDGEYRTVDENLKPKAGLYGHPGMDWGSAVDSVCGYNEELGFATCVGFTSAIGMNCSLPKDQNEYMDVASSCVVYDALLDVVGGPRLNCSHFPSSGPLWPECKWFPSWN